MARKPLLADWRGVANKDFALFAAALRVFRCAKIECTEQFQIVCFLKRLLLQPIGIPNYDFVNDATESPSSLNLNFFKF